jgi:hypothetical protein
MRRHLSFLQLEHEAPGLDRWGKSRLPPGFDPRTVQLVASRYIDYANRPTCVYKAATEIVLYLQKASQKMAYMKGKVL